ncbi:unnamed protein product [Lampetra fluviatilis]
MEERGVARFRERLLEARDRVAPRLWSVQGTRAPDALGITQVPNSRAARGQTAARVALGTRGSAKQTADGGSHLTLSLGKYQRRAPGGSGRRRAARAGTREQRNMPARVNVTHERASAACRQRRPQLCVVAAKSGGSACPTAATQGTEPCLMLLAELVPDVRATWGSARPGSSWKSEEGSESVVMET